MMIGYVIFDWDNHFGSNICHWMQNGATQLDSMMKSKTAGALLYTAASVSKQDILNLSRKQNFAYFKRNNDLD